MACHGLSDKGKEILKNMRSEYGKEKGENVFFASKNAGKISGVERAKKKVAGLKAGKKE